MVRSFINVLLELLQFQAILSTCNITHFWILLPPQSQPYQHTSSYATAWEWLINKEIILLAKVTKPLCVKEFLVMEDLKTKHLMQ